MTTKLQTNQIVHDEALKSLAQNPRSELKSIVSAVAKELDFPLRPHATFPIPDSKLNFGESATPVGDGANKVLPPIKGQILSLSANPYIDFMTGEVSSSSDFDIAFPVNASSGTFRRAGFTLLGSGQIKVIFSEEYSILSDVPNPGSFLVNGGIPLGYIDLESVGMTGFKTAGSTNAVIENTSIYRFGSGAGGGGGTGDANDFTENLKHRLVESFFNYVTPCVFATLGESLVMDKTASFNIAEEAYVFQAGQYILSHQLFNEEFIASGNIARSIEVHAEWLEIDESAVFEVSLDGGDTFEEVPMERHGLGQKVTGRVFVTTPNTFDLRLKITAGLASKLKAFGVFYDEYRGTYSNDNTRSETFTFSGDENKTEFILSEIVPDESRLKAYDAGAGQVFVPPAFTLVGVKAVFPDGMFHVPGETITLKFEQI